MVRVVEDRKTAAGTTVVIVCALIDNFSPLAALKLSPIESDTSKLVGVHHHIQPCTREKCLKNSVGSALVPQKSRR